MNRSKSHNCFSDHGKSFAYHTAKCINQLVLKCYSNLVGACQGAHDPDLRSSQDLLLASARLG
jgi:hypothetical protein